MAGGFCVLFFATNLSSDSSAGILCDRLLSGENDGYGCAAGDAHYSDHSHISGGISKINTADNVFGIFTSRAMRERGRYQIQLMKTRSSSGVGMKVDLDFDIESLRITDSGEEAQGTPGTVKPQIGSIMNSIKPKSTAEENSKVDVEVQSNKLKQMLAGLKSSTPT